MTSCGFFSLQSKVVQSLVAHHRRIEAAQELVQTPFVARQGNLSKDCRMLHCDHLDAGRVRHITVSRIVRPAEWIRHILAHIASLTAAISPSNLKGQPRYPNPTKTTMKKLSKRSLTNQNDRGVRSSRQRPSWFDSCSFTSSIAFKTRHIVVASQGKTRSLNRRQLQQMHQQDAVPCSKLLTLPLEIRLMIYDHIFTAHDTTYSDVRLTSCRNAREGALRKARPPLEYHIIGHPCTGEEVLFESDRAYLGLATPNAEDTANLERKEDVNTQYQESKLGVMALMLTCRALYHDILDVFYSHRTWQFNDLDTLVVAAKHIPRQNFNNIRSLYLNSKRLPLYTDFTGYMWDLPSSYRQRFTHLAPPPKTLKSRILRRRDTGEIRIWQAVCDIIAGMESLKRLRVHLCKQAFIVVLACGRPRVQNTRESFIFGPLADIGKRRDLEIFEVQIDWPVGDDDAWAEEAEKGFTLIRLAEGSHPGWQ